VAAHPIAVCATDNQRRHLIGAPPDRIREDVPRYRFHVVAPDVDDAVARAGGLICDRAMAGWDVTVLVAGDAEGAAIQMLGATVASLGTPSTAGLEPVRREREGAPPAAPPPQLLAVAADLFVGDDAVRDLVLGAMGHGATELLLWGRRPPPGLNSSYRETGYRPSVAALAFKAHALAARRACCPPDLADERFLSAT
jgi:hypothetical protein